MVVFRFLVKFLLIILIFIPKQSFAEFYLSEIDSNYAKKVILAQDNFLPIVNISIAFKGSGYANEHKDKLGLTRLFINLSNEFEFSSDQDNLRNIIKRKAIKLDFSSDRNNFYIDISFNSNDYLFVARILEKFFTEQGFTAEKLKQKKSDLLITIQQNNKNSNFIAKSNLLNKLIKSENYKQTSFGSKETLDNIVIADLKNIVKNRFSRDNLFIAISGNISQSKIKKLLELGFSNLKHNNSIKINKIEFNQPSFSKINFPDRDQVIIISAIEAYANQNQKEYYNFYLLNHIIGDSGLNSKLGKLLREELGLTYSANSNLYKIADKTIWVMNFATDKAKYEEALFEIKNFINNLAPITKEELEQIKHKVSQERKIYFTTNQKVSSFLLGKIINGQNYKSINAELDNLSEVTTDDINELIKRIKDFKLYTTVIVGDL